MKSRGITRDLKIYPDPDSFRPERWRSPSFPTYREPLTQFPTLKGFSQFGYGRRTCVGVDIVEQELFLVMGGLAWGFDIGVEKGREMPSADKYTSLLIAKPEKFEFEMKAVSQERLAMVESMWRGVNGGAVEDEEEVGKGDHNEKRELVDV